MSTAKPTRTAEQLRAMAQVRLNALPEVARVMAKDAKLGPRVGEPQAHERDTAGRNWDVAELRYGVGYVDAFRAIVNELRDAYDLA